MRRDASAMKRIPLLSLALLGALASFLLIHRDATAEPSCHKVSATITDALTSENCPSPIGVCTTGTITGDGLLNGSVFIVANAVAPAATPGALTFDIEMHITTARGTLTFQGANIFDPARGVLSAILVSPVGTGGFEDVTGRLFANSDTASSPSVGELRGELCFGQ
jgi:hypothetical protein